MAVAMLTAACDAAVDPMDSVTLQYSGDAVAVVAGVYGMPADAVDVTWVTSPMTDSDGRAVDGMAYGCDVYVSWWSARWTSGRAVDGPAISSTALAHEMAHCALSLAGDSDHDHTRSDWWGAGGRVANANAALVATGL